MSTIYRETANFSIRRRRKTLTGKRTNTSEAAAQLDNGKFSLVIPCAIPNLGGPTKNSSASNWWYSVFYSLSQTTIITTKENLLAIRKFLFFAYLESAFLFLSTGCWFVDGGGALLFSNLSAFLLPPELLPLTRDVSDETFHLNMLPIQTTFFGERFSVSSKKTNYWKVETAG